MNDLHDSVDIDNGFDGWMTDGNAVDWHWTINQNRPDQSRAGLPSFLMILQLLGSLVLCFLSASALVRSWLPSV